MTPAESIDRDVGCCVTITASPVGNDAGVQTKLSSPAGFGLRGRSGDLFVLVLCDFSGIDYRGPTVTLIE